MPCGRGILFVDPLRREMIGLNSNKALKLAFLAKLHSIFRISQTIGSFSLCIVIRLEIYRLLNATICGNWIFYMLGMLYF